MKKLIIAGGTGYLGQVLVSHFETEFDEIVLLSRKHKPTHNGCRTVVWDAKTIGLWAQELNNAEVLINMTGRSVDCRYNDLNKAVILNSRVVSTNILGLAVASSEHPPKVWLNSSTATIYRHSEDLQMDEHSGEIGTGFSVDVAKAWENSFFSSETPHTKKVALRTAIVLGKNGGALTPIKRLTQLGLGGKQGSGFQKFSWIHERDFARALAFCIENNLIDGPVNIVAPTPSDNRTLMSLMRKKLGIPFGIPSSKSLLEFGARLIRTETELILKSRNVIPLKLQKAQFKFEFSTLSEALNDILQ